MKMSCDEFAERWHAELDACRSNMSAELLGHVQECDTCLEQLSEWRQVRERLPVWKSVTVPIGLCDQVLARLQEDSAQVNEPPVQPDSRGRSSAVFAAMLAAAALLLMLGIGWRISRSTIVARQSSTQSIQMISSNSPATPDIHHLLDDARDAYSALASEAWQQVTATHALMPSADIVPQLPADESMQRISEPLSRPLAPIRSELRDAWNSLMEQVFPNSQDSST